MIARAASLAAVLVIANILACENFQADHPSVKHMAVRPVNSKPVESNPAKCDPDKLTEAELAYMGLHPKSKGLKYSKQEAISQAANLFRGRP